MSIAWTSVHEPTIWSFRDFCWAIALPGNNPKPNAVIVDRLSKLRRFMVFSLDIVTSAVFKRSELSALNFVLPSYLQAARRRFP
jgi:hypothetical protein